MISFVRHIARCSIPMRPIRVGPEEIQKNSMCIGSDRETLHFQRSISVAETI
jgi:hypothetical protein